MYRRKKQSFNSPDKNPDKRRVAEEPNIKDRKTSFGISWK